MHDRNPTPRPTVRRWRRGLAALLLMMPVVMAAAAPARAEVLLERAVVLTGEWAPFTSERMDGDGMLTALVSEVLRGMGREPDYQFLPFSDALDKAGAGRVLGTFPWFRNTDREKRFVYSEPLLDVEYVIFFDPAKKSEIADITNFDGLRNFATVRVAGYAYGKLDDLLGPGTTDCPQDADAAKVVDNNCIVSSEYAAFAELRAGRVDYVAASRAVGESLIRRAFPLADRAHFAVLERPELRWSMPVHFLFSKSRADAVDLKRDFDKAFRELKSSGRVAELRQSLDWQTRWQGNLVAIDAPSDGSTILGRAAPDAADSLVLPRGSRGVVVQWSARFRGAAPAPDSPALSEVQLVNGPLRGRRVWVRDDLIRLNGN